MKSDSLSDSFLAPAILACLVVFTFLGAGALSLIG